MTESEWLSCADPQAMLKHIGDDCSPRKLRLFACACARQVWHLLTDERSRDCVLVAERYADGLAGEDELLAAYDAAWSVNERVANADPWSIVHGAVWSATHTAYNAYEDPDSTTYGPAWRAAKQAAYGTADGRGWRTAKSDDWTAAKRAQADLLRDIIGNPFRPATLAIARRTSAVLALAPARLTSTVFTLAETIYHERDWLALPVLADALEEAGRTEAEVIQHLRSPGPHVRGCWALDLVMGKV